MCVCLTSLHQTPQQPGQHFSSAIHFHLMTGAEGWAGHKGTNTERVKGQSSYAPSGKILKPFSAVLKLLMLHNPSSASTVNYLPDMVSCLMSTLSVLHCMSRRWRSTAGNKAPLQKFTPFWYGSLGVGCNTSAKSYPSYKDLGHRQPGGIPTDIAFIIGG